MKSIARPAGAGSRPSGSVVTVKCELAQVSLLKMQAPCCLGVVRDASALKGDAVTLGEDTPGYFKAPSESNSVGVLGKSALLSICMVSILRTRHGTS